MDQTLPDLPALDAPIDIATVRQTQPTINESAASATAEEPFFFVKAQKEKLPEKKEEVLTKAEKEDKLRESKNKGILFIICLLISLFVIPLITTNNSGTNLIPLAGNVRLLSDSDLNITSAAPKIDQLEYISGKYFYRLPHIIFPYRSSTTYSNGIKKDVPCLVGLSLRELQKQITINKQYTAMASSYVSPYQSSQSISLKSTGTQEAILSPEEKKDFYFANFVVISTSASGIIKAFDIDKIDGKNHFAGITDTLEVFLFYNNIYIKEIWCTHEDSEFAKRVTETTTRLGITKIDSYSIKIISATVGYGEEDKKQENVKGSGYGSIIITLSGITSGVEKIIIVAAIDLSQAKLVWYTETDMTSAIEKDGMNLNVLDELQLKKKKVKFF